jgi:hypothetical protein
VAVATGRGSVGPPGLKREGNRCDRLKILVPLEMQVLPGLHEPFCGTQATILAQKVPGLKCLRSDANRSLAGDPIG